MSFLLDASINNYRLIFVPWNFFLLLIPFFIALAISFFWGNNKFCKTEQVIVAVFLFLLWLLFIPNSAYVIMDARHIAGFCPDSYYYNCLDKVWIVFFFFLYGAIGFYGFVFVMKYSLKEFEKIIKNRILKFFPYTIMPLVSLGVLLGLVSRLNSWDVLLRPNIIADNIKLYFSSFSHFKSLVFTSIFYSIIYALGERIFKFPIKW